MVTPTICSAVRKIYESLRVEAVQDPGLVHKTAHSCHTVSTIDNTAWFHILPSGSGGIGVWRRLCGNLLVEIGWNHVNAWTRG